MRTDDVQWHHTGEDRESRAVHSVFTAQALWGYSLIWLLTNMGKPLINKEDLIVFLLRKRGATRGSYYYSSQDRIILYLVLLVTTYNSIIYSCIRHMLYNIKPFPHCQKYNQLLLLLVQLAAKMIIASVLVIALLVILVTITNITDMAAISIAPIAVQCFLS